MEIQKAIEAAPEGATIRIGPGTYYEKQLVLEKSLVLQGAGASKTTIKAVDSGAALIVRGSGYPNLTSVTLQGLSIIAQGSSPVLSESGGIGLAVEGQRQGQGVLQVMVQGCWIYGYGGVGVRGLAKVTVQQTFIRAVGSGVVVREQSEADISESQIKGGRDLLLLTGAGIGAVEGGKISLHRVSIFDWGLGLAAGEGSLIALTESSIYSNGGDGALLIGDAIVELRKNKIENNLGYGIELALPPCYPEDEIVRFRGTVRGSDNEIHDNTKGNLCPPDYPWPEGFVREEN